MPLAAQPLGLSSGERGTQRYMSLAAPIVASLRLRRRSTASLIRVGNEQLWVELTTQPPAGAILDVGFPVVVTDCKHVAGGGMLITAERIPESDGR